MAVANLTRLTSELQGSVDKARWDIENSFSERALTDLMSAQRNRNLTISRVRAIYPGEPTKEISELFKRIDEQSAEMEALKKKLPSDLIAKEAKHMRRLVTLHNFNIALNSLEHKRDELSERRNWGAFQAADILWTDLYQTRSRYLDDETFTLDDFKTKCHELIEHAATKSELKYHRGWGKILRDLAFIVTNIVTLGAASLVSKMVTSDARFFKVPKTASVQLLDQIEHTMQRTEESNISDELAMSYNPYSAQ